MNKLPILPKKPKFGESCNGCGQCCTAALCHIGELMFGRSAALPCPALVMSPCGTRTLCAVVATEIANNMAPVTQEALGIGDGCGMED